ncbi:hypothetical protein PG987_014723 [Apiospora arundinis]
MSVDWGMAAVAVALSAFVAPIAWNGVTAQARKMYRGGRRIRQLKWDDVPNGLVHDCKFIFETHTFLLSHGSQQETGSLSCILANIFNRAWGTSYARRRFVSDVPQVLPTAGSFLCIEARLILAFALLAETSVDNLLACKRIEDIVIYHARSGNHELRHFRPNLSKLEVQCLLEGYPPWYRESFKTIHNISLPFPIRDARDISRGGWVVAVGLMDQNLEAQKPLRIYRCPDEPAEPGWRNNGRTFRMAIVRCRDHIVRHIRPHFVDEGSVEAAIIALNYLIEERTGSGMPWGSLSKKELIPPLRGSDCRFVMRHFNEYKALTDPADVARYEGIMMPVMSAVVHGAYAVVQYLKDVGTELKLPTELTNFQQEIYLKIDN